MREFTSGRENGHRRPRGYADWRPQASTRRLLADVDRVLERYVEHLPLTIRQVFYALVGAGRLDKTELAYARLCKHLNRARRARLIDFADLRDDGVTVMRSRFYNSLADFHDETGRRARDYRRDRQSGQPCYIELWSEAQGMMPQLERVADPYSVPVYSCGGFASLSAVRQIAQRACDRDGPTVVLHVGDRDPSGESIFSAMAEDAAAFVRADRTLATQRIEAVRVALTAGQVSDCHLPTAPAKRSDSRSRSWVGGTCQLEALPPDVLATIVSDTIASHMSAQQLVAVVATEQEERAQLLGLPRGAS
jgi:hypothetical protein